MQHRIKTASRPIQVQELYTLVDALALKARVFFGKYGQVTYRYFTQDHRPRLLAELVCKPHQPARALVYIRQTPQRR